MDEKEILNILSKGENHTTEFKKSQTSITKDVYESVCAFSNRDGGNIFLGVKDNGNRTKLCRTDKKGFRDSHQ